uniref:Uncharacterized protein n=1 Tax=viral metagenome TaxID=1070528 RepID=A0A6C0KE77_9ZZZZ
MKLNISNITLFYTNWAFALHCVHFAGVIPSTRLISTSVALLGTIVTLYNTLGNAQHSFLSSGVAHTLHLLPPLFFYFKNDDYQQPETKMLSLSVGTYLLYITFVRKMNVLKLYSNTYMYPYRGTYK